jgi:hypothetical protein
VLRQQAVFGKNLSYGRGGHAGLRLVM